MKAENAERASSVQDTKEKAVEKVKELAKSASERQGGHTQEGRHNTDRAYLWQ